MLFVMITTAVVAKDFGLSVEKK
jgi:hypothetical protein